MRKSACGEANASFIGEVVRIDGWVNRRRDHGGLIFIDVRDRSGVTQVLFSPELRETFALAESLRGEDVVRVTGTVRRRPEGTDNPKLATGEVEIAAERLEILNRSLTPPFVIAGEEYVDESVRLKYRYLDLRRSRMQRNLAVRHRIVKAMRDYFDEHDFLEIETPHLIKSTPEGARDYLVPSRVHQGSFYALPQSPQLLKQILMIGGLGRYMQIARCFRDEDPRADRQPEFSQLDVEMSFVEQEDVMAMMEGCVRYVWRHALGMSIPDPLPRMAHAEALRRYGSDKPDLRFGLELVDVLELFAHSEFALFRALSEQPGSRVIALRYPGGASLSRRDFDALAETAKGFGAKGLAYLTLGADGVKGSIAKFVDDGLAGRLRGLTDAQDGDALLFVGDASALASDAAGRLRAHVGERLGLLDPAASSFCWVIDFPLFERDADSGEITFAHHPFTSPLPGQEALLDSDPMGMRARHYDLVLNGYELGSGSIRNHSAEYQRKIFRKLGMSDAEIDDRFGFFLEALNYGAPPHGGMALGLDRIAMLACGESSIRDVIAFPKNQMARDMMMDSPSSVSPTQLRDLGIELKVPTAV